MLSSLLSLVVAQPALLSLCSSTVLTVGGTNPDYPTIQAAINAASDGDVILVRAGAYGGFGVSGKSLSVVADPPGSAMVGGRVGVRNIGVGQTVMVSGFAVDYAGSNAIDVRGVWWGAVRIQSVVATAHGESFGDACALLGCRNVAISNCRFQGGEQGVAPALAPGDGIFGFGATFVLHDTVAIGGRGRPGIVVGSTVIPAGWGGVGCELGSSSLMFGAGCSIQGGIGGDGSPAICLPIPVSASAGAPGGYGLYASQKTTPPLLLDCRLVGGAGGIGGAGDPACGLPAAADGYQGPPGGPFTPIAGTARKLDAATVVRELHSLSIRVRGVPGDLAVLRIGNAPDFHFEASAHGVHLIADGGERLVLGTIPASGELLSNLPVQDLGPGVQARVWYLQAICTDLAGDRWLTGPSTVLLLDSAF